MIDTIACPFGWRELDHCFKRPSSEMTINGELSSVENSDCWNAKKNGDQKRSDNTVLARDS